MTKKVRNILIGAGAALVVVAAGFFAVMTIERAKAKALAVERSAMLQLIDDAQLQAIKPNSRSIDFKLQGLDGKSHTLASLRGKVVLLNFWASWCGPCQMEIPSLEALYKKYSESGLVVLGVDVAEESGTVKEFVAKAGMTFPILLDETTHVSAQYGASGIPLSYFIDKQGNVNSVASGPRDWTSPESSKLVEGLLAE